MSNSLSTVIKERHAVRSYDPNVEISKEEILDMLEEATLAPSSSNLQPWEFIVFLDPQAKKDLREIAYNQEQVETSSAVIAVLGDKEMYKNIEQVYQSSVDEGHIDEERKEMLVANANRAYPHAPEEVRQNIATFDTGLAAMQFMLIAKDRGFETCPMGGFDKEKFMEQFNVSDRYFPVALITLGKAETAAYKTTRLPIEDKVRVI